MDTWICVTCGTGFPPGGAPPDACPICQDERQYVGLQGRMYSYPNLIPLPAAEVRRIGVASARYPFDRIYGAWVDAVVESDAKGVVARSVERYARAVDGPGADPGSAK